MRWKAVGSPSAVILPECQCTPLPGPPIVPILRALRWQPTPLRGQIPLVLEAFSCWSPLGSHNYCQHQCRRRGSSVDVDGELFSCQLLFAGPGHDNSSSSLPACRGHLEGHQYPCPVHSNQDGLVLVRLEDIFQQSPTTSFWLTLLNCDGPDGSGVCSEGQGLCFSYGNPERQNLKCVS